MSGGDKARLEAAIARLDGLLDVQRPHQTVLGSPHGQVDDAHLPAYRLPLAATIVAKVTQSLKSIGGATIRAALQNGNFGQKRGQRADGGGLGGSLLAANENAANLGVDGVQKQGPLHRRLADDSGKWETGYGPLIQGLISICPHSGISR